MKAKTMPEVNLIPKEYKKRKEALITIFSKTGGAVLVLFILSLLFYGGLLLYQNKLTKNLNSIKEEMVILDQKRDLEMEKAIIDLDKNIVILKDLFENHVYWSELFTKIEELTLPQAYFSETKLDFSGDKVNIHFSGNTLSYTTLARQMKSFQEESSVENVKVSGISLSNEGGIKFDLEIIFSKEVLLKKPTEL